MPKEWLTGWAAAWRGILALAAVLLALLAGAPARGEFREGAEAVAARAVAGDALALEGGRVLRLAGILAPNAADRGPEREVKAAAEAARAALETLARGRNFRLWPSGAGEDRHGRILAHAKGTGGKWLQDELLRLGHARVFTLAGGAERAGEMLKIEAEARAARRGLWALGAYAVRSDAEAGRFTDSFQLVEGRVVKAAPAREIYYLNFDRDFRRDFTIGLDRATLRAFRRAGLDPATLEGKRLRVRGWVIWRGGPYIGATHPEQIETIE